MNRDRKTLALLALAVLLVVGTAGSVLGGCQVFANSRPTFLIGYGPVCANSGSSCTECSEPSGRQCVGYDFTAMVCIEHVVP